MAGPSPALLAVQQHLTRHLGAPTEVLELPQGSEAPLSVAHFAAIGASGPEVLSTAGASRVALPDGRRVELLTIVRPPPGQPERAAIGRLLGRIGGLALKKTPLSPGFLLPVPGELPRSTLDTLLLAPPSTFIPAFQRLLRPDGKTVEWLWCIPISQPEAEHLRASGLKALMSQFANQGVELADWWRPGLGRFLRPEQFEEAREAREAALLASAAAPRRPLPSKPARPLRGAAPIPPRRKPPG